MPLICRARTVFGSRRTNLITVHAITGATIAEPSTPSLASARCSPLNASPEISRETVNPIPATAPAPNSSGQLIGGRGPWKIGRDASHDAPTIPTGLPST